MESFADTSALFAVGGHREAAALVVLGLLAQRHRGAEHLGVAAADGTVLRHRRWADDRDRALRSTPTLPGPLAIGKTSGSPDAAPRPGPPELEGGGEALAFGRYRGGPIAAVVSGRLTNGGRLRRDLRESGALLQTGSDAEVVLHLVAQSNQRTFVNRLVDACWKLEGAWSLLALCEDRLVAVRGPGGFRPLVLGRWADTWLVATEDAAVHAVGGEVRREVAAGELVVLDGRSMMSVSPFVSRPVTACLQEHVVVARDEGRAFGRSTREVRRALGAALAAAHPAEGAEVVVPWPGPSEVVAEGFAAATGLPLERAIVAEPGCLVSEEEALEVTSVAPRLAWRVDGALVQDRSVALVAPSLVTGLGLRRCVSRLEEAGAREVHLRIASPPSLGACPYGLWSPTTDELSRASSADRADRLGADSIGILTLEQLRGVAGPDGWCDACWSGRLPTPASDADDQLELF